MRRPTSAVFWRAQRSDLGPVLGDDLPGLDEVAERFRHRPPLLVQDEPVGNAGPVRRGALGADADDQGAVEPAAVLVVAFDVDIRGPGKVRTPPENGMARPGLEPDIEDGVLFFAPRGPRLGG